MEPNENIQPTPPPLPPERDLPPSRRRRPKRRTHHFAPPPKIADPYKVLLTNQLWTLPLIALFWWWDSWIGLAIILAVDIGLIVFMWWKGFFKPWRYPFIKGALALARYDVKETKRWIEKARRKADTYGPNDIRRGTMLFGVGDFYRLQGRYEEAEAMLQEALAIFEEKAGPNAVSVAEAANNLAVMYTDLGKLDLAQPLYERTLDIFEKLRPATDGLVALILCNLAHVEKYRGRFADAEVLLNRADRLLRPLKGQELIQVHHLVNLAELAVERGDLAEAKDLLREAFDLLKAKPMEPAQHLLTAVCRANLAAVFRREGRFGQAEAACDDALAYTEMICPDHPLTSLCYLELGSIYWGQERIEDADEMFDYGWSIREDLSLPDHPLLLPHLRDYEAMLRHTNQNEEADAVSARIERFAQPPPLDESLHVKEGPPAE